MPILHDGVNGYISNIQNQSKNNIQNRHKEANNRLMALVSMLENAHANQKSRKGKTGDKNFFAKGSITVNVKTIHQKTSQNEKKIRNGPTKLNQETNIGEQSHKYPKILRKNFANAYRGNQNKYFQRFRQHPFSHHNKTEEQNCEGNAVIK